MFGARLFSVTSERADGFAQGWRRLLGPSTQPELRAHEHDVHNLLVSDLVGVRQHAVLWKRSHVRAGACARVCAVETLGARRYALEPWSGFYEVQSPIWTSAHWCQFTSPGWMLLPGASGMLASGGSYVTAVAPGGKDATIVLETLAGACLRCSGGASKPQNVTFVLAGGMPVGPYHVWMTNSTSYFTYVGALVPWNGALRPLLWGAPLGQPPRCCCAATALRRHTQRLCSDGLDADNIHNCDGEARRGGDARATLRRVPVSVRRCVRRLRE